MIEVEIVEAGIALTDGRRRYEGRVVIPWDEIGTLSGKLIGEVLRHRLHEATAPKEAS